MAYIITSKTRKRAPVNRMLIMENKDSGERLIVEPRDADRMLGKNRGWQDPKPAKPGNEM